MRLYREKQDEFRAYRLEKPLWVFVGSSVNAVRTEQGRKVSDVVDILLFLAGFVRDRANAVARIGRLLHGQAGLLDPKGREIFANAFAYLVSKGDAPEAIFDDILVMLFNAHVAAALHLAGCGKISDFCELCPALLTEGERREFSSLVLTVG